MRALVAAIVCPGADLRSGVVEPEEQRLVQEFVAHAPVTWLHTSARNSRWAEAENLSQPIEFIGAGCRSRTRDLLITNQLLYRLS